MSETKIEWADRTWNPVTGCTKVSPGCDHCYAEGIAHRFAGTPAFPNGFDVTLHPERLEAPFGWRKPARVFVNSMSDLFHDDIPDEFIAQVFGVMAASPLHTFQILSKRHGRMRSLLGSEKFRLMVVDQRITHADGQYERVFETWPLPNVWLGVSVEDQKRADLRIPALLDTPAAVRFLSCEPLLGRVSIWEHLTNPSNPRRLVGHALPHLDWAIIGGESGPGARPMDLVWAEQLVDQCRIGGVACFVKQLGSAWAKDQSVAGKTVSARGDSKGGDPQWWPSGLQVRQYPTDAFMQAVTG